MQNNEFEQNRDFRYQIENQQIQTVRQTLLKPTLRNQRHEQSSNHSPALPRTHESTHTQSYFHSFKLNCPNLYSDATDLQSESNVFTLDTRTIRRFVLKKSQRWSYLFMAGL